MKQCILLWSFLCFTMICPAQVLQDRITGKYYFDVKSTDIKGSPFLYDEWRPSLITYSSGLQLKNVKLRFDQLNNKPLFLRNDSAFEFVQEVWEFVIYNADSDSVIFRNGFSGADNISLNTYLQVLEEGKLDLLRYQPKTKTETKGFSTATSTTEFTLYPSTLYLQQDKNLIKVKRNDEAAMKAIMKKEWEMVSDFIKQKKLNLRKDADFVSVIQFYNSL